MPCRAERVEISSRAFEHLPERVAVGLDLGEQRRVEEIAVALERLLRRVDERLGLVPELGELAPEGVGLLEALALVNESIDLVGR